MTDAASGPRAVTANFINPETMHQPAGYTHVVQVTAGRPIYIAGQIALDPMVTLVGPGDIRAQTRQVFDNLQAALQAVGTGFEQLVKLTYYLVDAAQLPVVREVRDQYAGLGRTHNASPSAATDALASVTGHRLRLRALWTEPEDDHAVAVPMPHRHTGQGQHTSGSPRLQSKLKLK